LRTRIKNPSPPSNKHVFLPHEQADSDEMLEARVSMAASAKEKARYS
jgi:hypothetical protein